MWRPPQKSSKSNVRQRHKPVNFDCLLHLIIKIKPQLFLGGNSTLGLHTLISKTDAVLKINLKVQVCQELFLGNGVGSGGNKKVRLRIGLCLRIFWGKRSMLILWTAAHAALEWYNLI